MISQLSYRCSPHTPLKSLQNTMDLNLVQYLFGQFQKSFYRLLHYIHHRGLP